MMHSFLLEQIEKIELGALLDFLARIQQDQREILVSNKTFKSWVFLFLGGRDSCPDVPEVRVPFVQVYLSMDSIQEFSKTCRKPNCKFLVGQCLTFYRKVYIGGI